MIDSNKKQEDVTVGYLVHLFKVIVGHWKIFLIGGVISFLICFFYLRYTAKSFEAKAKIQLFEKKDGIEMPSVKNIFKQSTINLSNEVELIKSSKIVEFVVDKYDLNIKHFIVGAVKDEPCFNLPYKFENTISNSSIKNQVNYYIEILNDGKFEVNEEVFFSNGNSTLTTYKFENFSTKFINNLLPFDFEFDKSLYESVQSNFLIKYYPVKYISTAFIENLDVNSTGSDSEILDLVLTGENSALVQFALSEIINEYNYDGVRDKQLIHQQTIDFIDDRFHLLSFELDSIEITKKNFKSSNQIVDIMANSEISLKLGSSSDEEVFFIENQITLAKLFKETVVNIHQELLPANIGLENADINLYISNFNEEILKLKKIQSSGGANNPIVRVLNGNIQKIKNNINFSLSNYINQLKASKENLTQKNEKFTSQILSIPNQEKELRSIERSQKITESLYLFLMQKREEAEISLAITTPIIKIVEPSYSNGIPVEPIGFRYYSLAFFATFFFPGIYIYILSTINDKVFSKSDISEKIDNPVVLGQIPLEIDSNLVDIQNNRSPLAESFRILVSNLKFLLTNNTDKKAEIIMFTSTIKGEGKTFCSFNTSLTLASYGKKVLLVGSDLRNPQVHNFIDEDKNRVGLTNFLIDPKLDLENHIIKGTSNLSNHHIILSGPTPPNPAQLLSNGNFEKFFHKFSSYYDYIVVDTAPMLLVADTSLIVHLSDLLVYVTRFGFTDKEILEFAQETITSKMIKNVAFMINAVNLNSDNYAYRYGYRYDYHYKYQYNYGYSYEADEE